MQAPTPGDHALRRARDQHRQFRRALAEIGKRIDDLADPVEKVVEELRERIARVEAELDAHFRLEEEVGFVAAAVEEAPRLSRRAATLLAEHDGLRRQMARIRKQVSDSPLSGTGTREAFRRFVLAMRRHEEEENRLIGEALLDDIGGRG